MEEKVKVRNGFGHFLKKITDQPATIAYFGSSNTALNSGWRPIIQNWLNVQFPNKGKHREINATIGGTGSITGAFVATSIFSDECPDLVFIEYSDADAKFGNNPPDIVPYSVEALVRNIKLVNPNCDICFIYFYCDQFKKQQEDGLTWVEQIYGKAADYYGIPSINVAKYILDMAHSGKMSLTGSDREKCIFSQEDMAHPTPAAQEKICEFIKDSLLRIIENSSLAMGDYNLPAPVMPNGAANYKICNVRPGMISGSYRLKIRNIGNVHSKVRYCSLFPGSKLSFLLKGTLVGLQVAIGPDSGVISCNIAGRAIVKNLSDDWCYFDRVWSAILISKIDDMKTKKWQPVTIELLSRLPDDPKLFTKPFRKPVKDPSQWKLNVINLFVIGDIRQDVTFVKVAVFYAKLHWTLLSNFLVLSYSTVSIFIKRVMVRAKIWK